jgi:hypothetical protein
MTTEAENKQIVAEENWRKAHPRSTERRLAWRTFTTEDGTKITQPVRIASPQDAREAVRLGKGEWSKPEEAPARKAARGWGDPSSEIERFRAARRAEPKPKWRGSKPSTRQR